jgi:glycosyltransferase involved in cell wall biosynthesis
MKLAFINDSIYKYAAALPSAVGGAERQQWLLARALAAAQRSIVVGVTHELRAGNRVTIDGVDFIGIGHEHQHVFSSWHRFFLQERPQWCYWRGADHALGPAVEIAKISKVKTIFSAAFDTDVWPWRALSRRSYCWPFYAWGLFRCEKIFVQHDKQLSDLPAQYRKKANVVPSIAGIVPTATAKSHYVRGTYVAWVGILRQPKRPDLLVEIARKAADVHFIVCGAPNTHRSPAGFGERVIKELQSLPNVDFLGQVPPQKAQEVIGNAAVLLSTSDGEGFPNTFLQAWGSGTPVVSLKIDPNHVIGQLGLGSLHNNIDDLIAQIRWLINTPTERDEIGVRARQYVEAKHSEAAVLAQFEFAIGKIHDPSMCAVTLCEPSSRSQ